MRKYAIFLAALLALSVTGCGRQKEESSAQMTYAESTDTTAATAETTTAAEETSKATTSAASTSTAGDATTAQTAVSGEVTTEFTLPELPDITVTTLTTTAGSTAATSTQTTAATTSAAAETAVTIGSKLTVEAERITAKPGDTSVPFTVRLHNNPGMATLALTISCGELVPVGTGQPNQAYYTDGDAAKGLITTCMFNDSNGLLAYGAFGTADLKADGTIFTCYFDIPKDAKPGTEYALRCDVASMSNAAGKVLKPEVISGSITVE